MFNRISAFASQITFFSSHTAIQIKFIQPTSTFTHQINYSFAKDGLSIKKRLVAKKKRLEDAEKKKAEELKNSSTSDLLFKSDSASVFYRGTIRRAHVRKSGRAIFTEHQLIHMTKMMNHKSQ